MVRYWSYLDDYQNDRWRLLALVDRVFSSGQLILGSEVERFESLFSDYCGARFGVGVNSGTDALFLALKALGIGQGDEVVTVANTAVPTVAAIHATGARAVFVDVERETFLMDADILPAAVTAKTRCILPVHLFGQTADMDAILAVADRHGLPVIEDCAQAAGASYRGKKAGSMGAVGAFSFYPTKVLGALGDGGMAVTSDERLSRKLKRLRFYGMERNYYAEEDGYNSRLDEVQAALLADKLDGLDRAVHKRRSIAEQYSRGLMDTGDIALPAVRSGRTHQFYAYTIRTRRRDALARYLLEQGIETKINYPVPVHLMRAYASLGYRAGDLPATEELAATILSLPIYPSLPGSSVDAVIAAIREFFRG